MLGRGFPPQLGEPFDPVRVEATEIPGRDAEPQQKRDLLERLDELGRRMGGRLVAEPLEHAAASGRVEVEEAIQDRMSLHGQQRSQPIEGLRLGLLARSGHQPFQAGEPWADNLITVELLAGQLEQQGGFVMLQRALDQPGLQGVETQWGRQPEAEIRLHLLEVGRAGFNPLPIRVNGRSRDIQLSCDIEEHLLRGGAEVIGGEAQIAQGTELQGKPQACMRLALVVDDLLIGLRYEEERPEIVVGNLRRKMVEPVAVCWGQKANRHRGLLAANDPLLTPSPAPVRRGAEGHFRVAVCRLI